MRICLLTPKYPPDPGGLAISAHRIVHLFAREGLRPHVCCPDSQLAPGERQSVEIDGVWHHRFGPQRRPEDAQMEWFEYVVALNRQYGFDLIHGHYLAAAGFVAVYAARYLGLPVVVGARGNDLERSVFAPDHSGNIHWALQHADMVTAVSADMQRKAAALVDHDRVVTVHNSVDTSRFCASPPIPNLRAELRLKADAPLLGFVGEARQKKGLSELLLAQAELSGRAEGTPPALLLVGGVRGKDKELLQLFKKQNPGVKVRRIPYLQDKGRLVALYNALDMLLLPSRRDGLPNTLLEGMACGLPIIATNVGGIPDAIQHEHNGILIEPNSVKGIVAAVEALLPDPQKRTRLGRQARLTAVERFRWERELKGYLLVYQSLVSG